MTKKPTVADFRRVAWDNNGNISKIAEHYSVSRPTVYAWLKQKTYSAVNEELKVIKRRKMSERVVKSLDVVDYWLTQNDLQAAKLVLNSAHGDFSEQAAIKKAFRELLSEFEKTLEPEAYEQVLRTMSRFG